METMFWSTPKNFGNEVSVEGGRPQPALTGPKLVLAPRWLKEQLEKPERRVGADKGSATGNLLYSRRPTRYTHCMATNKIVPPKQQPGGFVVRIVSDDGARQTILGFETKAQAQDWIKADRKRSRLARTNSLQSGD